MKEAYIVLEGPDGSGTTSHSALLADSLRKRGLNVLQTNEPTPGLIGSFIRQSLQEKRGIPASALQLLFCADRAMHMDRTIRPTLAKGDSIVSDRCFYSTLAYGEALGLDVDWLTRVNDAFVKPDLVILALPPLRVCLERLHGRNNLDELEEDSLQARVHHAYETMAKMHPEWYVVDTSGPMQDAAQAIERRVNEFLQGNH